MAENRGASVRVRNLPGIRRLPMYLKLLRQWAEEGRAIVATDQLAQACDIVTAVVKKDIELTGASGKTGVGYDLEQLITAIEVFLGWDRETNAVLVGAGRLGTALLGYSGLRRRGVRFVAAFDNDPNKIGSSEHGVPIVSIDQLTTWTRKRGITLGVLTVPSAVAQELTDRLVAGGVTRLWSFASHVLSVPAGVTVQREDLSAGLAELMVRSRFGDA